MSKQRTYEQAFSGGEISPGMYGRIGDPKFQSGLATCQNFAPLPHGPATFVPGTYYVAAEKDSTKKVRMIPFTFSATQSMALEVGAGYFRFHTQKATLTAGSPAAYNGGTTYAYADLVVSGGINYYSLQSGNVGNTPVSSPTWWYAMPSNGYYEIPNSYAEADLPALKYVESLDVLTITHPSYPVMELRRYAATTWKFVAASFVNVTTTAALSTLTHNGGGGVAETDRYVITAVYPDGTESYPISGNKQAIDNLTNVAYSGSRLELTYAAVGSDDLDAGGYVYIDLTTRTQLDKKTFLITSVDTGALKVQITNLDGTEVSGVTTGALGAGTAYRMAIATTMGNANEYNKLQWTADSNAKSYNIYKQVLQDGGSVYGWLGNTIGLTYRDSGTPADKSKQPPNSANPFANSNYPGATSYFDQRRMFAGSTNNPQTVWSTKPSTETDMSTSVPTVDSDSMEFTIKSRQSVMIKHLVPLGNLILLTSANEYKVSASQSDALTPTDIVAKPQAYIGANDATPVIVGNNLLYAAARGGHLREMTYMWQSNGYVSGDITLRATHLFDQLDIVDLGYSKSPYSIVWILSTSGQLIGLTYVPEQQVGAFFQRPTTNGTIESFCVIPEGDEDVVYMSVKRHINGSDVRYIECFSNWHFATLADAFRVDCGLTYSGSPATTISGLDHLKGQTVNILADGAVVGQQVVSDTGTITLAIAASKVQVGLPLTGLVKTLPAAMQLDAGMGQGNIKNVNSVFIRVESTGGLQVGPDTDRLTPYASRGDEAFGSPPNLVTGMIEQKIMPDFNYDGSFVIEQTDPLPATLVSYGLEVEVSA